MTTFILYEEVNHDGYCAQHLRRAFSFETRQVMLNTPARSSRSIVFIITYWYNPRNAAHALLFHEMQTWPLWGSDLLIWFEELSRPGWKTSGLFHTGHFSLRHRSFLTSSSSCACNCLRLNNINNFVVMQTAECEKKLDKNQIYLLSFS